MPFAGADYLAREGVPYTPGALREHIVPTLSRLSMDTWTLQSSEGEDEVVSVKPRFRTSSMVSPRRAACANLGISALPGYIHRREIDDGSPVCVLPGWTITNASFSAAIAYRTGIPPRVRALLNFLASELPKALTFERQTGDDRP